MEFFKKTPTIPFMANRRRWYAVSVVLVLGSIALLAIRGLNFGIDFTGGVSLELKYPEPPNIQAVRDVVKQAGYDALVTSFGSDQDLLVRSRLTEGSESAEVVGDKIAAALKTNNPGVKVMGRELVYPQVGEELSEQGGLALLVTFLGILVYVGWRFEWKMALGTIFAAMHDPIVILGFFAATQMTFDLSVLAAVLAVIGYSINDTVVVFDRVRECFHLMKKAHAGDVIDAAVNQTLSRTLMTSFSTLFVVVSLYLVGGEALEGFSAAIIVGVFVGTFSSIFVAGALALDMNLNIRDLLTVQKDKSELDALP